MNIDQANAWKAAMAAEEKQRAERDAAWQEEEQRQREQACKIVNHHFRHPVLLALIGDRLYRRSDGFPNPSQRVESGG